MLDLLFGFSKQKHKINKREKIIRIEKSRRQFKKYTAFVKNKSTHKVRRIHFGDKRYQQFKDLTKLKVYKKLNHGDKKRRQNYFMRHSGVPNKRKALHKEWIKSRGKYNAKILSHQYLW